MLASHSFPSLPDSLYCSSLICGSPPPFPDISAQIISTFGSIVLVFSVFAPCRCFGIAGPRYPCWRTFRFTLGTASMFYYPIALSPTENPSIFQEKSMWINKYFKKLLKYSFTGFLVFFFKSEPIEWDWLIDNFVRQLAIKTFIKISCSYLHFLLRRQLFRQIIILFLFCFKWKIIVLFNLRLSEVVWDVTKCITSISLLLFSNQAKFLCLYPFKSIPQLAFTK